MQCMTCFRSYPKEKMGKHNGEDCCDKCAAKFLKYAFGRKE